jgi:hypothetical protein
MDRLLMNLIGHGASALENCCMTRIAIEFGLQTCVALFTTETIRSQLAPEVKKRKLVTLTAVDVCSSFLLY